MTPTGASTSPVQILKPNAVAVTKNATALVMEGYSYFKIKFVCRNLLINVVNPVNYCIINYFMTILHFHNCQMC